MTKAKSSSVRRSETEALRKVTEWTKRQLDDLRKNSRIPICVELSNGDYTVGTRRVTKVSNVCWRVGTIEFGDKRSAIYYCVLMHQEKVLEAKELFEVDWAVSKLDSDKSLFRVRLDNAHLADDQFKIDLYSSRYEDAKRRLAVAKRDLEKIISKAKYIHEPFRNLT